jgi:hypothetical protein
VQKVKNIPTRYSCGKGVRDCCVWRLMKANVFGLFPPNFFVEGSKCEALSQTVSGAKSFELLVPILLSKCNSMHISLISAI